MISPRRLRSLSALRARGLALLERAHDLVGRRTEALRLILRENLRREIRASWTSPAVRIVLRAAPWAIVVLATVLLGLMLGVTMLAASRVDALRLMPLAPSDCPSRLYAQPRSLAVGDRVGLREVAAELEAQRYRLAVDRISRGTYWVRPGHLVVGLRPYPVPVGESRYRGNQRLDVFARGDRIERVLVDGEPASGPVPLDPPLLASVTDDRLVDCSPVGLGELPEHVVHAIMAAEDDDFYNHSGISTTGILRAAWVNLVSGEVRQGGSTMTQQLVKNLYLTPERSLRRKAEEALLALALEARHSKQEIFTAYVNHAYWGRRGNTELVGIGAAARAWLGEDAAELSLPDAALLAAMIRSPGSYDPTRHPVRARARRDLVLREMRSDGWIDEEALQAALAMPLRTAPPARPPLAPHFARWATAEAERRFGVALPGAGLRVLTTLRLADQRRARAAIDRWLPRLDGRRRLDTALVSLDPVSGAILAYVGGRDWSSSRFDRVSQARRQLGSAFKPVVYATAVEQGVAFADDFVRDMPMLVAYKDEYWMPANSDRDSHGLVPVHRALELSLNVPTARLALAAGLERIRDAAAELHLLAPGAEAVPSLALGTAVVSPLEVAGAYAALAADGARPTPHGIAAAYGPEVDRVPGSLPKEPEPVFTAETAYLTTRMLQGVIDRGTAASVRSHGLRDPLAGKTGTSDDQRDAWFAGYAPGRVTVVWVGRDDDRPAGYYGSQAALPIWTDFMRDVRPAGGYTDWTPPAGLARIQIDPDTGGRATPWCPRAVVAFYPADRTPDACARHSSRRPPLRRSGVGDVIDAILRPDRDWLRALSSPTGYDPRDHGTRPRNWRQRARFLGAVFPLADAGDPWADFQHLLGRLRPRSVLVGEARLYEIPTGLELPCADRDRAVIEGNGCGSAPDASR